MRVLRVLLGVVAILVALPLLLGGVTLWAAMQHRADDGSFTAPLAPIHTGGYAVVGTGRAARPGRDGARRAAHRRRVGQRRDDAALARPDRVGPADPRDRRLPYRHGAAVLAAPPARDRVRGRAQPGPGDRRPAG